MLNVPFGECYVYSLFGLLINWISIVDALTFRKHLIGVAV